MQCKISYSRQTRENCARLSTANMAESDLASSSLASSTNQEIQSTIVEARDIIAQLIDGVTNSPSIGGRNCAPVTPRPARNEQQRSVGANSSTPCQIYIIARSKNTVDCSDFPLNLLEAMPHPQVVNAIVGKQGKWVRGRKKLRLPLGFMPSFALPRKVKCSYRLPKKDII